MLRFFSQESFLICPPDTVVNLLIPPQRLKEMEALRCQIQGRTCTTYYILCMDLTRSGSQMLSGIQTNPQHVTAGDFTGVFCDDEMSLLPTSPVFGRFSRFQTALQSAEERGEAAFWSTLHTHSHSQLTQIDFSLRLQLCALNVQMMF